MPLVEHPSETPCAEYTSLGSTFSRLQFGHFIAPTFPRSAVFPFHPRPYLSSARSIDERHHSENPTFRFLSPSSPSKELARLLLSTCRRELLSACPLNSPDAHLDEDLGGATGPTQRLLDSRHTRFRLGEGGKAACYASSAIIGQEYSEWWVANCANRVEQIMYLYG